MAGFIIKRLLQAIFVILAVTLIVAFAIRLSGDPAIMLMGGGNVTEQDLQNIRQALGLERPFYVQYLGFLEGILTRRFPP
jgi:peptide/nickel transport system permease protein